MAGDPDKQVELSVVAPMYNEQAIIEHSLRKLVDALSSFPSTWELILVNDGSTDTTLALLTEQARGDDRITVVSYDRNRGRGFALRTGINHSRGRYVVTTESDLTWGKEIIAQLYQALREDDADIVVASPYANGGKLENVPLNRALLSRLGNRILRLSTSSPITMLTGMTRGYRGELVRKLPLEEDGKEIHLEIVSKAGMLGWRFSEVPATLRWEPPQPGRRRRKSKFRAGKLMRSHLFLGFSEAPVLLFGTLGGIVWMVGFVLGAYLCYLFFIRGQVIGERVVLLMTTIFLLLGGISLFSFCFLSYQVRALRKDLFLLHCRGPANPDLSSRPVGGPADRDMPHDH
ncbi:MAG: glycosyltransferase family 2 protein [bacterium]|nr:glycosyltransferase family 2 protein [bacterium]